MSEDFITLGEAARLLSEQGVAGVTYWKVWNRATSGKFPTVRVAGRILVNRSHLPQIAATFTPERLAG